MPALFLTFFGSLAIALPVSAEQAALMQVAACRGGFRAARALCRRTELLLGR